MLLRFLDTLFFSKHISGIKSREQRVKAFLSILVTKKNWFKILLTAIRDANEGKYDEVLHRLEPGSGRLFLCSAYCLFCLNENRFYSYSKQNCLPRTKVLLQ